jgi:biopolymer transport protein ExbD
MAFQTPAASRDIAEMNITPLVDVMLVLLIIFMVTAPLLGRPLPLDLPSFRPDPPPPPKVVTLRIDADGHLHWNGSPLPAAALDAMLVIESRRDAPLPLLALEVSPDADYAHVANILGRARAAGIVNIGLP